MVQITKLIATIFLSSIFAFDFVYSTFSLKSIVLEEKDDIKTICAARKCIRKCCSKDEYVSKASHGCASFERSFNFTNIPVYDDNDPRVKINKTFSDLFLLVPGRFSEVLEDKNFKNQTFKDNAIVLSNYDILTYLTESGKLLMESPNSHKRWIPVDHFCIDYVYKFGKTATPKFWSIIIDDTESPRSIIFDATVLLVSSVFLFVVLIVHVVLPELRNLAGMILMAYVFSLMVSFVTLASMSLETYYSEMCINITAIIYFFFLASFCWMNVMSFDIWWTFRTVQRRDMFKFGWYSLYAWGVPLLMTIALVAINNADLSHMPWFVKPQVPVHGCFLTGGQKLLYMYVPMLILIMCNVVFLLMTVITVWRVSHSISTRSEDADRTAAYRKKRSRLRLYFKLSIITGVSWIIEVVSFYAPESQAIWNVTDTYNLLLGVSIFIIFICNKTIYRKLRNRFYGCFNIEPRRNNESIFNNNNETVLIDNEMETRSNINQDI